jgi:hypothetical protein
MSVKAGSVTHPGSGSFSVTGAGFKPLWGIFMATNLASEGSWTGGTVVGALGFASVENNVDGELTIKQCGYHEIWENEGVGGVWLGDIALYLQSARDGAVDGWTAYVTSFDADGFSMASGITAGASGKRIYYILGDENFEEVASGFFIPGTSPLTLGWEPQAFFGVGYGGATTHPIYNVGFTDLSLPTVVAGDWGEYASLARETNGVWRGITDPNVNIQFWMGNDDASPGAIPILEPLITGGVFFSSDVTALRTPTTFEADVVATAGFGNGDARIGNMILGSVDSIVGSFIPSATLDVPTQVVLPFVPEAVVLFSPQEHRSGVASQAVQGATGWGWCTEEEQALTIFGGHWNPPDTFQTAAYQSSVRCWVANCLDRDSGATGTVGTEVVMGTAQINDQGFEHTTKEHAADAGEVWPVHYWAFAPVTDDPGFFRRV